MTGTARTRRDRGGAIDRVYLVASGDMRPSANAACGLGLDVRRCGDASLG